MEVKYFKGFLSSLLEVKKHYKQLAMIHHPDKGGSVRIMQEINTEYEYIVQNRLFGFDTEKQEKEFDEDYELRYPEIINKLMKLTGLYIELCGNWIWISGQTYPHREELKRIGCKYSPVKYMWYYRPDIFKSDNFKAVDMDSIRKKYGSVVIEGNRTEYLE